ncbi:MAG TPA: DUF1501 domain-containing protein [Marmoricola sp.]|nr:DUF1501 domain-containing protein [Marmoricola sp.]
MTDSSRSASRSDCGCPEFRLGRRGFLAAAAAGSALAAGGSLFGQAHRQVSFAATTGGNVLVVLSLRGGADGLSLVVPRLPEDREVLRKLRPGIAVPENSLIGGDAAFGLHPEFAPLLPMWRAGSFGAVHAVGLPAPNRSHFDAMEAIEDADPGSSARSGWLNRMVGLDAGAGPETAMHLGSSLLPTSLVGPAPALGAGAVKDLALTDLGTGAAARRTSLRQMWQGETGVLADSLRATLGTTERLAPLAEAAADRGAVHASAYPDGPLRAVLANTAALIRADVGTRVVTVDYGNWDMHNGLADGDRNPTRGWLAEQVRHLAGSLAAFFTDLGPAASRVTVVTLSEFGRRVEENGDHGVDHGYGNAMLLLGAGVRGGAVHGRWPGLGMLEQGDLPTTTDYRSVLWEVLTNRFPEVSGGRAGIFPGFVPETVRTMR